MRQWALVDPDGHCAGVVSLEGAPDDHGQQLGAGFRMVPVTAAAAPALRAIGHHAVLRADRWLVLPASTARKVDRARGLRADLAAAAVQTRDVVLAELQKAGAFAGLEQPDELDPRLPVPGAAKIQPLSKSFDPIDVGHAGLVIRHMTEDEVTPLSQIMLASGAYDGLSLQECWILAHTWYTDPNVWALVLDWNGAPLQFEIIHFDDPRPMSTARGGFVTHVTRERPSWFWREVSRPLFQALLAFGYRKLSGHVRPDRKDWADALAVTYGGQNLGSNGQWWFMSYDLAQMVGNAKGWPTPRTAGPAWAFAQGAVTMREAVPDDRDAIEAAMERLWGLRVRKPVAQRILRERLALDAATCVLAFVAGQINTIFVFRDRDVATSNWAVVTPWDTTLATAIAYKGATLWHQLAGYTKASAVFPTSMWDSAAADKQRSRLGWTEISRSVDPITGEAVAYAESLPIVDLLARPDSAWL